jgi:hypothetical protein
MFESPTNATTGVEARGATLVGVPDTTCVDVEHDAKVDAAITIATNVATTGLTRRLLEARSPLGCGHDSRAEV